MALNLTINAEVVDISKDHPRGDDVFVVDTNVWYWMTYTRASQVGAHPYQISAYPSYVSQALANYAKIYQSGLSLAELAHLIEKSEREIFEVINPGVSPKEFRHNFANERANVCAEVEAACSQILAMGDPLQTLIDGAMSESAMNRFVKEKVDGYDVLILESMLSHGVTQIITDDGDFATVAGIRVFTANKNVISAAQTQGKLLQR
jgi:predicted nucleic acid-binding protein